MHSTVRFEGEECWMSPRWAFARLARSASMFLQDDGDLEVLEAAVARDGLDFTLLDAPRAARLARALRQGAAWLREELIAEKSGLEADEELSLSLTPLSTMLANMLAAAVRREALERRAAAAARAPEPPRRRVVPSRR